MADAALPEETFRRWKESITPEETQLIVSCRANMTANMAAGSLVAGVATWAALSRLKNRVLRTSLALGFGYFGGLWGRHKSLESCAEKILSLDGSRIQTEYANMILSARRMNEQSKAMKIITRYFYSERVFDDSNSDLPKLRWRRRNFFDDTFVTGQIRQNSNSDDAYGDQYNGSNSGSNEENHKVSHKKFGHEQTGLHSKESSVSPSMSLVEDPLDYVFGSTATKDATANANANNSTSSTSPKKLSRKSKRSQRRQRRRLHEADA